MAEAMRKAGFQSPADYSKMADSPGYDAASALAQELIEGFTSGRFSKVELLYNHFKSTASQPTVRETFLPMASVSNGAAADFGLGTAAMPSQAAGPVILSDSEGSDVIIEPSRSELLAELLPKVQRLKIYTTLLDSYDKDVLNWKLKTAYLERWADKEIVTVRPVFVDIYDSIGERVAFLRADSGSLDMTFTYVYAYGHVYALTPKGASVRADSLLWNKKDNLVRTASYVRVVSEDGDVLQGVGFESDAQFDNWKILSNVTGIFQDAAKRMKDEDKRQAEAERLNNPPSSSSRAAPAAKPVSSSSLAKPRKGGLAGLPFMNNKAGKP